MRILPLQPGKKSVPILIAACIALLSVHAATATPLPAPATAPSAIALPVTTLREYVGHYRLAPGAVFDITLQGKQLYAQLTGQPNFPIYAIAKDEFFYKVVNAQIYFVRGKRGKVSALVLHQYGRNMRAPRTGTKAAPPTMAQRALAKKLAELHRCLTARPVYVKSAANVTLYGVLTLPKHSHDAPGILLIPGSGTVNLNGDGLYLRNHMYQQLAYALTCHGYAVLRYDKRGLGRSTGNGNDVTIEDYRSDVLALAHALSSEPGVAPHILILMGHSEGGLIAPYSAPELTGTLRAMVLLEAPGEPLARVLLDQSLREAKAHGATKAQLAKLQSQIQALTKAIRTSRSPHLKIPPTLENFPLAHVFAPAAGLFRSEMDLDPTSLIARVKVPILIVQGGADIQVGMANAKHLHAANPHSTLVVIPHMTHDLIRAHGTPIESAVPSPGALLDPTLVKRITTWLHTHVKLAAK